jgi:hypothetical protein
MKKGLLTVLLASLVLVGCQNYDDQFDDLNAQISALKSQVDGLASLSGQVSSLSGTISGLSSGVAAAQAAATAAGTSAQAATAAANAIDLTGLASSLATLQAEVDAVQASLATASTAAAVTALQAEVTAITASVADLLATSNIYSSNVSVTNATTLEAALALGNKVNVLNANLTVTGYSGMDYAKVQTLVDRVNTMTGNITYTAFSSTGTEVVFNNLISVGNITMTQPGGYHFPKLTNAAVIDMKDDYETVVTRVNFPVLATVTGLQTDAAADTIEFTYATSVDLGSLVVTPNAAMTITTKKDATLDLGSFKAVDAAGTARDSYSLTLNGPASFTNGTAAGTFASTGLPGNTLGLHDGTIALTNVATAAIHNFRGTLTLNTGVKDFTGNNIVTVGHSGATDLEKVNITFIRDNDPALSSASVADLSEENKTTAQDLSFGSTHTKLTSLTVTGKAGDVTASAVPNLATVDLTAAAAFDVNMSGNTSLTSFTDATSANDWTFDNNDVMTSVNASHTTTMTTGSGSTDTAATVSVSGNAEITTLTIGFDDVDGLTITSNAKLATIAGGTNLADNGTSTTTNVDIHQNALVASSIKDSKEAPSVTVVAGASSDTGSITTASGIKDLDAFLTDAVAATGIVSVWFDTVTKVEKQGTYGGSYTDNTSSLTAPAAWDDSTAATNAVDFTSTFTGYYAYVFSRDVNGGTTTTTGARANQVITYAFVTGMADNTFTDKALASSEGVSITGAGGTTVFDQGDSTLVGGTATTVATIDHLVTYLNNNTSYNTTDNMEIIAARDGAKSLLVTVSYVNSTAGAATAGVTSSAGAITFQMGTDAGTGAAKYLATASLPAGSAADDIADGLMDAIHADAQYQAVTMTSINSNVFKVTRSVSGTATADMSPLASIPTPSFVLDAAQTSTVAGLTPSAYNVASNLAGSNSSLFTLSAAGVDKAGLRVSLKNTGSLAFPATVTLVGDTASNTAIITSAAAQDGVNGLLVDGVSIGSYSSANYTGTADYVTTFAQVSAGTTSTTGAVTAVNTNRTTW